MTALKSFLFLVLAPGMVAGYIPLVLLLRGARLDLLARLLGQRVPRRGILLGVQHQDELVFAQCHGQNGEGL